MEKPYKPIFIVGHGRSGSTILAALLNWHKDVGPKFKDMRECPTLQCFMDRLLNKEYHKKYDGFVANTKKWLDMFPPHGSLFNGGPKEITEKLNIKQKLLCGGFVKKITEGLSPEERFLSKLPHNVFRVKAIKEIFPDAKFIALVRDGMSVVSSLGARDEWGFGTSSLPEWYEYKYNNLSYAEGIKIFAQKWTETLEYLLELEKEIDIPVITYEDMVLRTEDVMDRLLSFLDLEQTKEISSVNFANRVNRWKEVIPPEFWSLLEEETSRGKEIMNELQKDNITKERPVK